MALSQTLAGETTLTQAKFLIQVESSPARVILLACGILRRNAEAQRGLGQRARGCGSR